MVVAYHIDKTIVPAGHWGVTVFFVLSGYLITRSLCAEVDRTGRVDLASFYLKRGLRLFPALLAVCLVMLAVGTDWSRVVPALGLYANYARVEGVHLERLTHTWFVAVIGHFYLLWPLVIGALPGRHRLRVIGLLAVAAIAWRFTAIGVMSPGWVYNATDTNAAALLAGCYLGVARPRVWRFAGWSVPALLALMFLPVFGDAGAAVLWGGFVALALGAMAVLHATTRPAWLESQVLLRLAEVSYGLYLWHYVFLRSDIPVWTALLLTIVATAASWYLLEKPLVRWASRLTDSRRTPQPPRPLSRAEPEPRVEREQHISDAPQVGKQPPGVG
jgi:peptidoglycan/LPS O-acetylase OafA/YrhL